MIPRGAAVSSEEAWLGETVPILGIAGTPGCSGTIETQVGLYPDRRRSAMRLHGMMAVAACLLVGADDRDTIQGRWKPVSIERGGKPIASRTEPNDKMALDIEGDRYNWTGGDVPMGGTYTLDPSKTPKGIDVIPSGGPNQGRTLKGI